MPDILVIIASPREGGVGAMIGRWFLDQAGQRPDLRLDVMDLSRTPLPPIQSGNADGPGEEARALAARIAAADGFVVITPEYNHAYPACLKLAVDAVRHEWAAKPVGFVSYGGRSGGLRAVEQLRLVFAELHVMTLRDTVSFHQTPTQFDEKGRLTEPDGANGAAKVMLDQLIWWATTLSQGRAARPYTP
ncbi:NADPH-dependent FMN reductase [Streptosporangium carneum]|uniref:FMN reductase n=1 Tax=Streptosporangium carneum TaxID=47481 RepID=A0A9W6MAA2_9ACTN|nr:NAD(P)H-dependent oxidoreductase [Streptosporangium carneum]GLK06792.1 FMN reductase [Streptosporangium carneum]